MMLKWLTSWLNPNRPRVATRGLGGMGYVPRLEPLEDRNLPSGLPTITLSDGTVVQMTVATNPLIDVLNQGATNLASNSAVAVTFAYSAQGNLVSWQVTVPIFQPLSPVNIIRADVAFFDSQGSVVAAQNSDALGLSSSTISTTFFLSGLPDRGAATNYVIGVQTRFSQSYADLKVTIEGLDPRGNPSSAYITAVQGNSPIPTNLLQLPTSPNNGKEIIDVSTPLGGPSSLEGKNSGGGALANQLFPELLGNPSNPVAFAMNDTSFISIFILTQELEAGNLPNQPGPFLINEIPPDGLGKTTRAPAITNSTSLVLADTGSNTWLTLSILQDSYLRSTSAAAQITWTGLRGPAEALHPRLGGPLTPEWRNRRNEFSLESITAPSKELGSAGNVEISLSSRPMEAMVSDILGSLPQAKRDEKDEEMSLAALPVLESAGEKSKSQASLDWPFAGTVVGLLGTASLAGTDDSNTVAGLGNESPPLALLPADGGPPQEDQPDSDPPTKPAWRWVHLAEGVGGFLLLLAWPAVLDLGSGLARSRNGTE